MEFDMDEKVIIATDIGGEPFLLSELDNNILFEDFPADEDDIMISEFNHNEFPSFFPDQEIGEDTFVQNIRDLDTPSSKSDSMSSCGISAMTISNSNPQSPSIDQKNYVSEFDNNNFNNFGNHFNFSIKPTPTVVPAEPSATPIVAYIVPAKDITSFKKKIVRNKNTNQIIEKRYDKNNNLIIQTRGNEHFF